MQNFRKYGPDPFDIVLVHGGPGGAGQLAPVARELSANFGVLEPLQTKDSIEAQILELHDVINEHAKKPVTLIGHSYGAFLTSIFTSKYPLFIKKLILISSAPFEKKHATRIMQERFARLSEREKEELRNFIEKIDKKPPEEQNADFAKITKFAAKTDSFEMIPNEDEILKYDYNIYKNVWKEAEELRNSDKLLEMVKHIKCEAVAIHGCYDPHPHEGVKKPLSDALKSFKFILLDKCGHYPWLEKFAKDDFYKILKEELNA